MRLELALIIGVLFFCCWCAFIIVRMNSSVLAPSNTSPAEVFQQHQAISINPNDSMALYHQQSQVPTLSRQLIYSDGNSNNINNNNSDIAARAYLHYPRQPEANAPTPSYAELPIYGQHLRPPYQQYTAQAFANWPSESLGSRNQGQSTTSGLDRPVLQQWRPQRNYPARNYPIPAPRGYENANVLQSNHKQPEEQPASEEDQSDSDQNGEVDNNLRDNNDKEQQQDEEETNQEEPEVNQELEEQVGRRSFSEDQADASERDKNGDLVVTHKRHLINGKPVQVGTGDRSTRDNAKDKDSVKGTNGYSAADFDRIVDEIDDDESTNKPTTDYDEDTSTGSVNSTAKREASGIGTRKVLPKSINEKIVSYNGQPIGPKGKSRSKQIPRVEVKPISEEEEEVEDPLPKGKKDHHEHRVLESLKAQQWDDDATTSPQTKSRSNNDYDAKKKKPSKINGKAEKFEKKKKEGTANSAERKQVVGPEAEKEAEAEESTQAQDPQIEFEDLDLFGDSEFPFLESDEDQGKKRRRKRRQVNVEIVSKDVNKIIASGNINSIATNGTTTTTSGKSRGTNDLVTALEDLNVEVIQRPPVEEQPVVALALPVSQGWNVDGRRQLESSFGQAVGPYVASNGHSGGQLSGPTGSAVGGGLGEGGDDRMVSGSNVKKRKKIGKRIKGESKMSSSKYKAAKGHSMKKKSKSKKGGAKKRKRKLKKKVSKSHKEFRGATKGKKLAKGKGQRGGKKGALYYKDKGYKKKGFKKRYQKLETGDHKTYFDEFRDKDHNKKWKDFKDKHQYSQSKKWAGNDGKKYRKYDLKELKDKKTGSGSWKEKSRSKFRKDFEAEKKKKSKKGKKTS